MIVFNHVNNLHLKDYIWFLQNKKNIPMKVQDLIKHNQREKNLLLIMNLYMKEWKVMFLKRKIILIKLEKK